MSFKINESKNLVEQFELLMSLPLKQQLETLKNIEEEELFQTWDTLAKSHLCDSIERFEEGMPIDESLNKSLVGLGNIMFNLALDVDSSDITPTNRDKSNVIDEELKKAIDVVQQIDSHALLLSENAEET